MRNFAALVTIVVGLSSGIALIAAGANQFESGNILVSSWMFLAAAAINAVAYLVSGVLIEDES